MSREHHEKFPDANYIAEQNPIGRYLLELDGGDVSLFILLKMIGTFL